MFSIERKSQLSKFEKVDFDCLIIGGGATGVGTALDASLRGLSVGLCERYDFASGTSSRSTKLIHGGVRYLAQFHFGLIAEALSERKRLIQNAPHLVKPLKFLMPTYKIFEKPYYSLGLTLYDFLAGKSGLPSHKRVSKEEAVKDFPSINQNGLRGGIEYYDAQFNDARLNVLLARCAELEGAVIANQLALVSILKDKSGKINGAVLKDHLSNKEFKVKTKTIVNTTGIFIDEIRKMDDPNCKPILKPSQGIHLVFSKNDISCNTAMIIPKTSDGRVVFIIPWESHVMMGTTDTNRSDISYEPMPYKDEVEFLLKTGNEYLGTKLQKENVLSVFSGLRPLINLSGEGDTKNISREEMILVSSSGMITMSGGKWSTYRKMAEDLTNKIIELGKFNPTKSCTTYDYQFLGKDGYSENMYLKISSDYKLNIDSAKRLKNHYGGEVYSILGSKPKELIKNTGFFEEEVIHFIRKEFANTILDVLARRFRILFLDLEISKKLIKPILKIMAKELKWNDKRQKEEELKASKLIQEYMSTYK